MESPKKTLMMPGIQEQVPRHGGLGAAYLTVSTTSQDDATCRLFVEVQQQIHDRVAEPGTTPPLDALQPTALAEKLDPQLGALQKLKDPGLDPEQQQNTLAVFQELHAGLPTDVARDVITRSKGVVTNEIDFVRVGLRSIYAVSPGTVQDLATSIRARVESMRPPDLNWTPVVRWADLKRIADKLAQRRVLLPPPTLKVISDALTSEGHDLYTKCLKVLALEKIIAAWNDAKADFIGFLDEVKNWSREVVTALSSVKKNLEEIRAAVANNQAISRASVVKILTGATDNQVIVGMMKQVKAADEAELARILLGCWEAKLREICPLAAPWLDKAAPLPDLLRGIPPEVQAAAFRSVIEQSQGPGQSLYEILQREGLQECAEFLYSHSEPTVHLAGRHMAQLGLSPQRFTIVNLPLPSGPQDSAIRNDFIDALKSLDPDTTFANAPSSDCTVTMTRILDNFVIGIEEQNGGLLTHYKDAAEKNHRPHLFDLIPESPDGKAISDYLDLLSPSLKGKRHP